MNVQVRCEGGHNAKSQCGRNISRKTQQHLLKKFEGGYLFTTYDTNKSGYQKQLSITSGMIHLIQKNIIYYL